MSDINNIKVENSAVPAEEIKNPELTSAIEALQQENTPAKIEAVVDALFKAKLILPAKVNPTTQAVTENGQTVMKQATQVQFRLIENASKEKYFAAFTDTDEMFKWQGIEGANKVVIDFDSLSQMVTDPNAGVLGFVINPFGKSITFPKEMVASFKQQRDFLRSNAKQLDPKEPVRISEPDDYPVEMMAALITFFSKEPSVNAAYLREMEQKGEKSYLVVVDYSGNMEKIFTGAGAAAQPLLKEGTQLSMMPYAMPFAQQAVSGVEPFYKKQ